MEVAKFESNQVKSASLKSSIGQKSSISSFQISESFLISESQTFGSFQGNCFSNEI
jgi:hypothetical protein